jgi:putative transposase
MQEKDRENIALFRYGLIAPLLNIQSGSKSDYLAEICSRAHQVPYWGAKEYSRNTVDEWLRIYKKEGFDGLKPRQRSDKGRSRIIPLELQEPILELRRERRDLPVSMFYDLLVEKGMIMKADFSYSTIYRLLKKHELLGKEKRKEPERKRFAYDTVNILWQTDASHGPYLKVGGKKRPTYLLAFIDDCSRIVPAARFSFTEKSEDLMCVFEEALLRRGFPRMVYADNGKIFRSDQFHLACASLGITLVHTRPYDPAAKGKIERLFANIKLRFMPLFREKGITGIDELNAFFWEWLEKEYHRKMHSAINMTPLDKYLSQASQVKMVEDPGSLKLLFLKREYRKVRHDGTISVKNSLFEVPPVYIGQKIELRYDEKLKEVYVFSDGKQVAEARAVNMADNARVKREKPPLSFADLFKGGDD